MNEKSLLIKKAENIKKFRENLIEEQENTKKLNEHGILTKKQRERYIEDKGTFLGPVLPFKRSNGGTYKLKDIPYISRLK